MVCTLDSETVRAPKTVVVIMPELPIEALAVCVLLRVSVAKESADCGWLPTVALQWVESEKPSFPCMPPLD